MLPVYLICMSFIFTVEMLSHLLSLFEYYSTSRDLVPFYEDLLSRQDPTLSNDLRRSLLKRMADQTKGLARWEALLTAIELAAATTDTSLELEGLLSELSQSRDPAAAAALSKLARVPLNRQLLLAAQADLLPNAAAAQEIYLKLHQEGFVFRDGLVAVSTRMLEAKHPEHAAAIIEAAYRDQPWLTTMERVLLVRAYEALQRPLDAKRAQSDEPRWNGR